MLGMMMRPAGRVGVLGMRRGFATAPATTGGGAVATASGEAAPLALPGSYGMKELAILPLTLAANKMHLVGAGARWGVAAGIFLYMMIRPSEWDRVSERLPLCARASRTAVATDRKRAPREEGTQSAARARSRVRRACCWNTTLCCRNLNVASDAVQDDFWTRRFPHVPRQNYYDAVRSLLAFFCVSTFQKGTRKRHGVTRSVIVLALWTVWFCFHRKKARSCMRRNNLIAAGMLRA